MKLQRLFISIFFTFLIISTSVQGSWFTDFYYKYIYRTKSPISGLATGGSEIICNDQIDNDDDEKVDCADSDCGGGITSQQCGTLGYRYLQYLIGNPYNYQCETFWSVPYEFYSCVNNPQEGTGGMCCKLPGETTTTTILGTCECSSGACCDGCHYKNSNTICSTYGDKSCAQGTDCGSSIYYRYCKQYCSGSSSNCDGNINCDSYSLWSTCGQYFQCKETGDLTAVCENSYAVNCPPACYDECAKLGYDQGQCRVSTNPITPNCWDTITCWFNEHYYSGTNHCQVNANGSPGSLPYCMCYDIEDCCPTTNKCNQYCTSTGCNAPTNCGTETTTTLQGTTTTILSTTTTTRSSTTTIRSTTTIPQTTTTVVNPTCAQLCGDYDNWTCETWPCSSGRTDIGDSDNCGLLQACCCWDNPITTTTLLTSTTTIRPSTTTIQTTSTTLQSITTTSIITTTTIKSTCGNFIKEPGEDCEVSSDCSSCTQYCNNCKCEDITKDTGGCKYFDYCTNGFIPHTTTKCPSCNGGICMNNYCYNIMEDICYDEKYACHNLFTCS